ncbi:MAG: hypothetical protein HYY06_01380 [Deltaproteobacteria bacterium]|nr:hypothetical protein [Deltaproteobacteria bacterium]
MLSRACLAFTVFCVGCGGGGGEVTDDGEDCENGRDDDGDGLADCDDSECADDPVCEPATENCGDGRDDDGDGYSDCDDDDCAADPACAGGEGDCLDGMDEDGDGDVDCDDEDCADDPACLVEVCDNDLDDDGDGDADCDDEDCADDPACFHETDCDDDADEDGDGAADCDDDDCAADPACFHETDCGDGVDEDGDGTSDCDDEDCAADPACLHEADCDDDVDDDGDGATDCDDDDCAADPACFHETDCDDGADDDDDGATDCDDDDCAGDPACATPEDCDNESDDDGDDDVDCDDGDCAGDPACVTYDCGAFDEDPGWAVAEGFRAVVVAGGDAGLNQPVAAAFAGGGYGAFLYVVDQGNDTLFTLDVLTGDVAPFTSGADWADAPDLLTTITWDAEGVFDGALYVGDQGSDGDSDSTLYRVGTDGAATVFVTGPGPGLDDIYGLLFSPGDPYPEGLFITGDTDGAGDDWGIFDELGAGVVFSQVEGIEGLALDASGLYGGGIFASRPLGGGYTGDGSITPIGADGNAGEPLATGLGGIHAVVFAPEGPFGQQMVAASWSDGRLVSISPEGDVSELATGLQLTNYDGNILAFSADGRVLMVADRLASQVVCIEPVD